MSWLTENKDVVLALFRLISIGLGAILATDGLATMNETSKGDQLRAVEAQAGADVAKAEKFGVFDNIRDFIIDVEKKKAKCDVALETFSRHRKDNREFTATYKACHSLEN